MPPVAKADATTKVHQKEAKTRAESIAGQDDDKKTGKSPPA
jgi:hypothetical protein